MIIMVYGDPWPCKVLMSAWGTSEKHQGSVSQIQDETSVFHGPVYVIYIYIIILTICSYGPLVTITYNPINMFYVYPIDITSYKTRFIIGKRP